MSIDDFALSRRALALGLGASLLVGCGSGESYAQATANIRRPLDATHPDPSLNLCALQRSQATDTTPSPGASNEPRRALTFFRT